MVIEKPVSAAPTSVKDGGQSSAALNTNASPTAADKKDDKQNVVPPVPNATNEPDGVLSQLTAAEKEKNEAFEKALAEKDNKLSASEQARIDAAMGDDSEYVDSPRKASLRPEPTDPDVSAFSALRDSHLQKDSSLIGRLEAFVAAEGSVMKIITGLVRDIPSDTPDDHIIGGAAGHKLRLGHLRALVMGIHK